MAITKEINVVVKETGLDSVNAKVENLTKSTEELSNTQSKNSKSAKLNTQAIGEIAPASTSAVQSLLTMGKAMWAIVANPIGAILTAIVAVVYLLVSAFKTFQPLVDKVEQGMAALGAVMNVIKNTFIAVVTGTKSLGDAFGGLSNDMSDAAKRTIALTKAQQDLEDVMKSQEVTTAKQRAEINKLNVMAKNRNLTETERIALLNKAEGIEKSLFDKRVKLADEEVRIAREAIAIKANFSKAEIEFLKKTGDKTKELAESRGGNYDEEYDKLNKARIARIALEDESTANLEKNYNKQDALAQRQEDAAQKRREDARAAAEKAKEERLKRFEDERKKSEDELKLFNDFQISINNAKMQSRIDDTEEDQRRLNAISAEIDAIEEANQKKIESDRIASEKRIALENQVKDAKFQIANSIFDLVNMFAKKGSKLAKGVAVAQATMNTFQGVTAALSAPTTIPDPFGTPVKIANATLIAATGFMNVKKILSTNEQGSGSTGSASGSSTPQAPSFNLVQGTASNQVAQSIGKQMPVEAYVVSKNVSTGLELDRNIIKSASL